MSRVQRFPESSMYLKAHRIALVAAICLVMGIVGVLTPLGVAYCRHVFQDMDAELPTATMMIIACPPWFFVLTAVLVTSLLFGKEFLFGRALAFAFNLWAIFAMVVFVIFLVVSLLLPMVNLMQLVP